MSTPSTLAVATDNAEPALMTSTSASVAGGIEPESTSLTSAKALELGSADASGTMEAPDEGTTIEGAEVDTTATLEAVSAEVDTAPSTEAVIVDSSSALDSSLHVLIPFREASVEATVIGSSNGMDSIAVATMDSTVVTAVESTAVADAKLTTPVATDCVVIETSPTGPSSTLVSCPTSSKEGIDPPSEEVNRSASKQEDDLPLEIDSIQVPADWHPKPYVHISSIGGALTEEDMSVPSSPSDSEDFAEFLDGELESTSDSQSHSDIGVKDNNNQECFQRNLKKRKCDDGTEDSSRKSPVISGVDNKCDGSIESRICPPHPGYIHGLCIRCGSLKSSDEVADERNVALRYIHAGLEVSSQEAERIRSNELQKILLTRKLYLVLDLDHTLLNSARFIEVTSDENAYLQAVYLSKEGTAPKLCKESGLYYLQNLQMWTKLRPFALEFLKEASKLFELHLYTMGERIYAQTIANILDPAGNLFGSRVISQGESTRRTTKDLDVLLGAESAVIILDDTEAVWPKHKENLILMERYHFFGSSCKHFGIASASLMEAEKDESEDDGTLAHTLKLLKHAHTAFFDGYYQDPEGKTQTYAGQRDVREVLHTFRSGVLAGCKIVFSRIFPTGCTSPETHPLWRLAEGLGASCSTSVDATVTHIVALDNGTDKAKWAQENNCHLVHPRWVEAALHTWRRPCEEHYSINDALSLTTFSRTVNKARPEPETM